MNPKSKKVVIDTKANGYEVKVDGQPKSAVFVDTQSLITNLTEYFGNPSIIPWIATAGATTAA